MTSDDFLLNKLTQHID